jgi:acyl-coenzyme A thioesterase PaaI-like protein
MSLRKEIINPFSKHDAADYQCFGCSPYNTGGLHLSFFEEDGFLYGEWQPKKKFEGYKGVLHGGVQATMMDEIASWFIYTQIGTAGVTKKMEVAYKHPTRISDQPILLKAWLGEQNGNEITVNTELINGGKVTATARVTYFTFPEGIARRKYNYPGKEAFFNK